MAVLVSKLDLYAERVDPAVEIALQDTANFILTLIRAFAPVKTGWLRDSYRKEVITPTHILIGTMVFYSLFQEYGTRKMVGKPHVTPAFMQGEAFFKQALAARLRDLG